MRPPRVRLSLRGMMLAIAVVGAILGLIEERRARFARISRAHAREQANLDLTDVDVYLIFAGRQHDIEHPYSPSELEAEAKAERGAVLLAQFLDHHELMAEKYRRASSRPWLPVTSDPPEPPRPPGKYVERLLIATHPDPAPP